MRRVFTRVLVQAAFAGAVAVGIGGAQQGCLLALHPTAEQCQTDEDCTGRGAGFEGNVCSPDKVCVVSTTYCKSNAQCIDVHGAETWICDQSDAKNHHCVNLTSADCPRILGADDLKNENSIILGFPWVSSTASVLHSAEAAMELARRDLVQAGNLPPATPGGPSRPLVWVVCDANNDDFIPSQQRGFDWLAALKLPMMTGSLFPDTQTYEVTKALPTETAVFGFLPILPAFEGLPNRKELYLGQGDSGVAYIATLAAIAGLHEDAFRKAGVTRDLKISINIPADPVFARDVLKFIDQFKLNGKTGLAINPSGQDTTTGDNLRIVSLGADNDTSGAFAAALAKIEDFKPDILVNIGAHTGDVLIQYEKAIPGVARYVETEPAVGLDFSLIFKDAQDASRALGLLPSPPPDDPEYLAFGAYLSIAFPDEVNSSAAFGMYNVGIGIPLAIAGIPQGQPVNGRTIVKSFHDRFKQSALPRIGVNETAFHDGFNRLATGAPINFADIQFDDEGLGVLSRFDVLCPVPDKSLGGQQYKGAGVYYDTQQAKLIGTLQCP